MANIEVNAPVPEFPTLSGYAPCYSPLPQVDPQAQPARAVRPLYWWAVKLHKQCWGIRELHYRDAGYPHPQDGGNQIDLHAPQPNMGVATLVVQKPNYQIQALARTAPGREAVTDLAALVVESALRLGLAGYGDEIARLVKVMWVRALLQRPAAVRPSHRTIRGVGRSQPCLAVRIAYWWAHELMNHGWRLEGFGQLGGFVALIPTGAETTLFIYPSDMADDGTEASALARQVGHLTKRQCAELQELIDSVPRGRKVTSR
ncbi:Uncharacterised protein [Mycobacteroides abscessus subsp. abscessus]|uniref:hypothetical protein n=1 Tax=Mycobacteroides abscessus TaxID=36809 RepID=UPI00092BCD1F|nr:hypothetical protein [Mycobacteroides abscessus]SIC62814.1 Uncharacterised protein [Mycobacteroides abscessus subsp. abscessus]SIC94566.1 Uncharacterised protein [Mycobacteroides abscessus subsp. abscessus]SID21796.1 Uncharacterised protein [Mycobacteroides abscessus subsp. abscessus]SID43286.1 Uncharacterised protein [Mycobacteroides abscessus subsp. abscessus]SKV98692.1 Uncharacterised protein [Mycobacteroides abscessus subsp. abscessus]